MIKRTILSSIYRKIDLYLNLKYRSILIIIRLKLLILNAASFLPYIVITAYIELSINNINIFNNETTKRKN